MSEPRRMVDDEIPLEVRRLLEAVKADENPAAEQARAQLKASVARVTRPRPWGLRAPIAILIGLGSATAIALLVTKDAIPRPEPMSTSVTTSAPSTPAIVGAPSVEIPSLAVDALPAASIEARPPSRAPEIRAPEITPPNELKLLQDANAALEAGDARLAMRRCSEYRNRFPSGRFVAEIDAIEIRAYAAAGRCLEARSLGERFFERHADSPYARRIHSALADACP